MTGVPLAEYRTRLIVRCTQGLIKAPFFLLNSAHFLSFQAQIPPMKYNQNKAREYSELSVKLLKNDLSASDIPALVEVLSFHEYRYYVLHDPLVSDQEYDLLYKKLEDLESKFPEKILEDSPTQRVSSDLSSDFPEVTHTVPMLSLDNSYNAEDLQAFDKRIRELSGENEITYAIEPKFDGSSISLLYEDDRLIRAATRGNGEKGEEVTANVRTIPSIPLKCELSAKGIKRAEIRGEIVIRKAVFEKINREREKKGEKVLANARNSAAGALRLKDPRAVRERGLDAFMYQIGFAEDENGTDLLHENLVKHGDNIQWLGSMGFRIPSDGSQVVNGIDAVIEFVQAWEQGRDDYPYEVDGMVIKVNEREIQDKCGFTAHHPRWAMAYKFKAKQATTVLEGVEFQVGRTGAITPVAKVRPVPLAGVTISSISLHNEDMIIQKDIRLGDTLLIERAGDVIPYVVKSMSDLRDGSEEVITFPKDCPVCDSTLEKPQGEAVWRCVNAECPAQLEERIIHFVSKDALDIEGLGKDIVKRFYQLGILEKMEDIYRLDYSAISELEGWGERSVEKLKNGIEASKSRPLHRLLYGLGIRHIGTTTAKTLVSAVHDLRELADFTEEQLCELPDIGPKVASSIIDFFSIEQNRQLLSQFDSLGLKLQKDEEDFASNHKLNGKTFLFTGTLNQMGRKEAQQLVEDNGGKLLSSVSKNLDYLVAGEKAGSKLKKAQSIESIEIISEDDFLNMIA